MKLYFTKNSTKKHIIRYVRDNGTTTWMYADEFFIRHDLSHYALEKILCYKTAFNGMINAGMEIKDFEDREKRLSITVTAEAMYAETMANLFLIEISQSEFEDFNDVQKAAFTQFNHLYPETNIPSDKLTDIRALLLDLLEKWRTLPEEASLELTFP
jgi:hypothetical protein